MKKPRVFTLLDYYLPGYKSGGPLRTVANMVDWIGHEFDFWIVTRDRDATELTSYPNIQVNAWNQVGRAKVYYTSPGSLSLTNLHRLIKQVNPAIIYLNSFFSTSSIKSLSLRRLKFFSEVPVVLAPRGEFSVGALRLKAAKKQLYMALAFQIGLYDSIIWQASSIYEEKDIRRMVGRDCRVYIAPNIPSLVIPTKNQIPQKVRKITGLVHFVFLSRISPKKNLLLALHLLKDLFGEIILDIYGPIRDELYWRRCQEVIASMPSHVQVNYHGSIPNEKVADALSLSHFFILPTLGENFGHVILEAMAAGCPVLISDQTPWLNLSEKQAGWDLPLEEPKLWQQVLKQCIEMDNAAYSCWSHSAKQFVQDWLISSDLKSKNLALLTSALKQKQ